MTAEQVLPSLAAGRARPLGFLLPSQFARASQPPSEAGKARATVDIFQGPELGLCLRLWGEIELGFGPGGSGSRPGAPPPMPPQAPCRCRSHGPTDGSNSISALPFRTWGTLTLGFIICLLELRMPPPAVLRAVARVK